MPRKCTVCTHADLEAINQALISGESNRRIAARFSLSGSSVRRHRSDHLPQALTKAKEASEVAQADDLLAEMQKIQRATLNILGRNYTMGDDQTALKAIREARGNLEVLGKLQGKLQEQMTTVNVLVTSNDWLQMRSAILRALEPYPEARQAVSDAITPRVA